MGNELGSIFGHECYIEQGPTVPRKKFWTIFFYYAEVLFDLHMAYMHSQVGLSNNVGLFKGRATKGLFEHMNE